MNQIRSIGEKVFYHGRALLRVTGTLSFAVTLYGAAVYVYSERRWKTANSRMFDPPNWSGYTEEEREEIISNRKDFVETMKKLYEMNKEVVRDPATLNGFTTDCVLEDPKNRFVGRSEIIRAFSLLTNKIISMHFTTFEPTHYEKMIVIDSSREFEVKVPIKVHSRSPTRTLRSNLVVHLMKDESGKEKIHYVTDEWNFVSILQPDTHDVFLYAGTIAKWSRRISAITFYYFSKEEKSILNPFLLFELPTKVNDYVMKVFEKPADDVKDGQDHINEENTPVFNAGQIRTNG